MKMAECDRTMEEETMVLFLFLQSNTTAKGTIQEMIQAFSTALISTVLGGQSANYSSGALEV